MSRFNRTMITTLVTASDGSVLTVDHTDAYTAHDVVGAQLLGKIGGSGGALIRAVKILDYGVQSEPYIIHFYRSIASTIADDAAFAPTDADGLLEIGTVTVAAGDYATANGDAYSVAYLRGDNVNIEVPHNAAGLVYVYLQCTDTPDYVAATDLVVQLFSWID